MAGSCSKAQEGSAPANGSAANTGIKLARDADNRSTTYFENNYRKRWEDDLRMFQSKHPRDSKYNADAYKYRSRIFCALSPSTQLRHGSVLAW